MFGPGSSNGAGPSGAGPSEAGPAEDAPWAPPPWPVLLHQIDSQRFLTEDDPRAPTPPGFVGELWAPQAALLKAMLDLERRPVVHLEANAHPGGGHDVRRLEVRAARIAEKPSFGKTVLTLGLVLASRCPKAYLQACPLPLAPDVRNPAAIVIGRSANADGDSVVFDAGGRGRVPMLRERRQGVIRATLVIASPSVIGQWEENIKRFAPRVCFMTIDHVRTLRDFEEVFRDPGPDGLSSVDVVLLKAGRVTTSFKLPGEEFESTEKNRPLTVALGALTEGRTWARVIVDDFDSILFGADDDLPPALFTWVISATRRRSAKSCFRPGESKLTGEENYLATHRRYPLLGFAQDDLFSGVLQLNCDARFVDAHITSTRVRFRQIQVAGGRGVALIETLGVEDAEILEMASGGAVSTAAERLGIKADSVWDLFRRLLEKRLDAYRSALRTLSRIQRLRAAFAKWEPRGAPIPAWESDHAREVIRHASEDIFGIFLAAAAPSVAANESLERLATSAAKSRDKNGQVLERLRSNLREGDCQSCMLPLAAEGYIVNCCQIVICPTCAISVRGKARFLERCPNCQSAVDPRASLIYVGGGLLEDALRDDIAEPVAVSDDAAAPSGSGSGGPDEAEIEAIDDRADYFAKYAANPRLRALLQLLAGEPIEMITDEEIPPPVSGLLIGRRDIPLSPDMVHKTIVAAMHPESIRHIEDALKAAPASLRGALSYAVLRGTPKQREAAVDAWRPKHGVRILLLVANSSCSGLHLPEATRFVAYHKHIDDNVARQLFGRAQRVGRTVNLEIAMLVDEREYVAPDAAPPAGADA